MTTDRKPLTSEEISAIVDGFDPIDWVQMEVLAKLPPAKRLIPGLNAQEFSMGPYAALPQTISRIIHVRNQYEGIGLPDSCADGIQVTAISLGIWNKTPTRAKTEIEKGISRASGNLILKGTYA